LFSERPDEFLCEHGPRSFRPTHHPWLSTTAAKVSTAAERQQAAANYKVRFAEFVRDFSQYRAQQAGGG